MEGPHVRIATYFIAIFFALLTQLEAVEAEYERSTMAVEGHAVLRKPADELQLTIGVISTATTVREALEINNQKIQKVFQELQQLDLNPSEYQTNQFNIHPTYTLPPKNPPPDWKANINGYQVTNQITIQTEKLELAGAIIDQTSQTGVNTIDQISFNLKNRRVYQGESIALATKYATEDAQQLAQAANVKLLRIIYASLNQASPQYQPRMVQYAFKSSEMNGYNTPIAPGEIEITADVTLVYEIE